MLLRCNSIGDIGVTFNYKLTFNEHIIGIFAKAYQLLWFIY